MTSYRDERILGVSDDPEITPKLECDGYSYR